MDTIKYNGVTYKTRTFNIKRDGEEETITIAPNSLSVAMGDKKEIGGTQEENIDCEIYFYVLDEEMELDAKHICESLLDEPVVFVDECGDEGEDFLS